VDDEHWGHARERELFRGSAGRFAARAVPIAGD
jgi:hypothetical protein